MAGLLSGIMGLKNILSSRKNLWLFSVIFLEGYVVLATELLAIRLLVPFVGSGTEVISIIISAVLLPLAVGYHYGSRAYSSGFRKATRKGKSFGGLRSVILKNLLTSLIILSLGLSYVFLEMFFFITDHLGGDHVLVKTSIYCSVFLVYPVFLLGQTIPIMSNYFSQKNLSSATGAILFFSTIGSFLGSVFSTLVLMMIVGVHVTVIFTLALLFLLIVIIRQRLYSLEVFLAFVIVLFVWALNNNAGFIKNGIYSNNAYSLIAVVENKEEKSRTLMVNRSNSSKISEDPSDRFEYLRYIEDNYINTYQGNKPLEILIIGAGGFTIGKDDNFNNYHYVDIDPALKEVSEKYFLKEKLGANKHFYPTSARAYLAGDNRKYDVIFADAYTNVMSLPAECVTQEFFAEIKKKLAAGGVVIANIIAVPDFSDKFSKRIHNTFRSVFPHFNVHVVAGYNPWPPQFKKPYRNNLYIYIDRNQPADHEIYTDNLNTYSLDKY